MKKIVLLVFLFVLLSTAAVVLGSMTASTTVGLINQSSGSCGDGKFALASSKTIWVPDNFTSIQGAINNATDGDTIFVRAGIYYENVIINKRVSLTGENKCNTIIDGDRKGTTIRIDCDNVTISGFTTQKSGYSALDAGISVSSGNNISDNILRDNSGGILLYHYSGNNLILGNTASNNGHGIYIFHHSNNNTVSDNNVSDNQRGITIYDQSSNNTITGNTVFSNEYGIELIGAALINNAIYRNNFINNTQQVYINTWDSHNNVWDDGYPSGGNFWSNYSGADLKSGPNQRQPGSDGIGDIPHVINHDNQDNYPLIATTVFRVGQSTKFGVVWRGETYFVDIISNSTLAEFQFMQSDKSMTFNASGSSKTIGYCNVTISKDLLRGEPWTVLVNDHQISPEVTEDENLTYLYFLYNHSANRVQIIGTQVVNGVIHHVYPGQSIQDAINSAKPGETIFVHNGIYYEHVVVNKTVSLVGEDKYSTIVDGNGTGAVIYVTADNNNINGFTAQRSGDGLYHAGIYVYGSSYNNISCNIVTEGKRGIELRDSGNNIVANNIGLNNTWAIGVAGDSSDNMVAGNNVSNNHIGILISNTDNNTFTGNNASNNNIGILLQDGSNNTITENYASYNQEYGIALQNFGHRVDDNIIVNNTISFNNYGIYITDGDNNTIHHNKFIDNTNQTVVKRGHWAEYFDILVTNIWDDGNEGNYWSDYEERYPDAEDIDESGIWDTPYFVDENNQDNYPIVPEFPTWTPMLLLTVVTVVIAIYKRRSMKIE